LPYTLGQAAKATGKQKSTILEAIRNGRISAVKNDIGHYQIEPAELHRVYPPTPTTVANEHGETPPTTDRTELLEEKIRFLEREIVRLERTEADLKEDRNNWRKQATALLTYQPEQKAEASPEPTVKKSGFFEKLLGRNKTKV